MSQRNSRIILCKNINIDREYKNVTSYTTNEMLTLCRSQSHLIRELSDYSFVRVQERNRINTDFTYSECLQANYIAIENPDFSNKWFFCFIDKIEYNSDNATIINFTVDAWSTWFDNWNPRSCLVLREHVNDDTIGLHTFPEGLETGEFTNHDDKVKFGIGSCHAVVCTSEDPFRQTGNYPYNEVNSIPSGLHYFVVGDLGTSVNFIGWLTDWASSKSDLSLIQSIFMVPDSMTGYDPTPSSNYWSWAMTDGGLQNAPYHKLPIRTTGAFNLGDTTIPKPYDNIDGYVPKNNKLFVAPYNFMIVDNHGGTCEEFHYEDFTSANCVFTTKGDITPGCSIRTIPRNYKHIDYNYAEGINALKLPIGSWQGDVYTNWLTQNSVNLGVSLVPSAINSLVGVASGNYASAISSGLGIASTLGTIYEHSRMPNQVYGNQNSGDVTFSDGESTFTAYKRTIKSEYVRMIDNYFQKYGYLVNVLKVPNITGRQNWNYIQISSDDEIGNGSVPTSYMEEINNACRRGLTIWHNHENIGNYSLDNPIV